jgi:hypothetical protein
MLLVCVCVCVLLSTSFVTSDREDSLSRRNKERDKLFSFATDRQTDRQAERVECLASRIITMDLSSTNIIGEFINANIDVSTCKSLDEQSMSSYCSRLTTMFDRFSSFFERMMCKSPSRILLSFVFVEHFSLTHD